MDEKNEELIEIYPDVEESEKLASDEVNISVTDNEGNQEADLTKLPVQDDYASDIEAFEHDESDDEIIRNLSDSINRQVELDLVTMNIQDEVKAVETKDANRNFKDRFFSFIKSKYVLIIPITLFLILFIVVGVYYIGQVKKNVVQNASEYIADNVNYQEVTPVVELLEKDELSDAGENLEQNEGESVLPTEELEPTDEPVEEPTPTPEEVKEQKSLVNILLLGEENINSLASRGRTDLIDVLTLNLDKKTISITSILRDCKVSIPGYSDNRINAVYAMGGVSLLYDTIEQTFDFRPDNYILVNFSSFETVIDSLEGIDIELSAQEARYLNKTNYISNPAYRNVVEGMNHLNGNQALGYCRIRKVGTKNNEYSDFGRSSRHREVLSAIFTKFSKMSFSEMKKCSDEYLSTITTDLDAEDIENIINMLIEIGAKNMKEYRIPIDGSYKTAILRDMQVTEFNLDKNMAVLKEIVK